MGENLTAECLHHANSMRSILFSRDIADSVNLSPFIRLFCVKGLVKNTTVENQPKVDPGPHTRSYPKVDLDRFSQP